MVIVAVLGSVMITMSLEADSMVRIAVTLSCNPTSSSGIGMGIDKISIMTDDGWMVTVAEANKLSK